MYDGLVHLHNMLRWIILVLLILAIVQSAQKKSALKKTSLWLMLAAHTTLLLGLFQWLNGPFGLSLIDENGFGGVMRDGMMRFWAVEHITAMILAIVVISVARGKAKHLNYTSSLWLYALTLVIILVSIPWPFRAEGIARPWFPGM